MTSNLWLTVRLIWSTFHCINNLPIQNWNENQIKLPCTIKHNYKATVKDYFLHFANPISLQEMQTEKKKKGLYWLEKCIQAKTKALIHQKSKGFFFPSLFHSSPSVTVTLFFLHPNQFDRQNDLFSSLRRTGMT